MDNNTINVLVSTDEKQLKRLVAMLFSLKKHNGHISVYFMNQNISHRKMEKFMKKIKKKVKCDINEIKINDDYFSQAPIPKPFTIEMYFRLVSQFYLPEDLERIIWIDMDVICLKSIRKNYFQDFEDKSLIACRDISCDLENWIYHCRDLGLSDSHTYFNSGIMILNLRKLRQNSSVNKIMKTCSELRDALIYPDQDIMNVLYENDVKYESKFFNYQFFWKYPINSDNLKQICLLHYMGKDKPWMIRYMNQTSKYYWDVEKELGNYFKVAYSMTAYTFLRAVRKLKRILGIREVK